MDTGLQCSFPPATDAVGWDALIGAEQTFSGAMEMAQRAVMAGVDPAALRRAHERRTGVAS